jgi:hypothetical protein
LTPVMRALVLTRPSGDIPERWPKASPHYSAEVL